MRQFSTPTAPPQRGRPKQKISKSQEDFKEHERLIMNKRIAELNNVITKKCHTVWNQFLFEKEKPLSLRFSFVYNALAAYLLKCDEYKEEQHKDSKQKWWNNQKASEMSQRILPSVLATTDAVCTLCTLCTCSAHAHTCDRWRSTSESRCAPICAESSRTMSPSSCWTRPSRRCSARSGRARMKCFSVGSVFLSSSDTVHI